MDLTFTKTSGSFESSNSLDTAFYYVWTPKDPPSAVVQIVHSMCEHSGHYTEFAEFLASKGFVVCIHDQIGHGQTVKNENDLGFFADRDGDRYLLEDVEKLRAIMRKKYRRLPYFLFGHGLGSYIARAYTASYPENSVDALIISGTYSDKLKSKFGCLLSRIISAFRGKRHRSKLLYDLTFGKHNKSFKCDGENAWITNDLNTAQKYRSDTLSSFLPTTKAYYDMFMLITYNKTHTPPCSMPIYILSGTDDPAGAYGEGACQLYSRYFDSEISDVTLKLYEDERHEVLSGIKHHEAFNDVFTWMNRVIDAKVELMRQSILNF